MELDAFLIRENQFSGAELQGYKIARNLEQFKNEAEKFIEELQTQTALSDFNKF